MSYSTSRGAAAPASGSLRRPLTAVLAVAALLTGALAIAPAATAAATASLSGTVTMPGDVPAANVWVDLVEVDGTTHGDYAEGTYLDPEDDGAYHFEQVLPGTYTLEAGGIGVYSSQYAGGARDVRYATTVTVAANQAGTLDLTYSEGRTVSGTIRKANGEPLQTSVVLAQRYVQKHESGIDCCVNGSGTDEDGVYEFENVLAGEYSVRSDSQDGFVERWYGNVADEEDATTFVVTAAAGRTGVDISVPLGGKITGTVRGPNGQVLEDVYVIAFELQKDPWGLLEVSDDRSAYTDGDGRFSVDALDAGTYTIAFYDEQGRFPDQLLGGVTGLGGAKKLSISLGSTTTVNTTLTAKPFVSPSTPSITLSPAKRAYGKASTATVKVTPTKKGVTATGTVTLKDGGKVLGTKTLNGGKATFDVPKSLAIGTHSLTATFATNGDVQSSASGPVTLTVTKVKAKVKVNVNKAKTKVAVKVTSSVKATGKVVLKRGKKTLDSAKLKKRKATLSLEGLDAGKNKLRVIYQGSAKVQSDKKKLKVKIA